MAIELVINNNEAKVLFEELTVRDAFVYKGGYFIRIVKRTFSDGSELNAINVKTWEMIEFPDDQQVRRTSAKLIINAID